MLPAPFLYGVIIDNTCLWWNTECGVQANCFIYSNEQMMYGFQGIILSTQQLWLCHLLRKRLIFKGM